MDLNDWRLKAYKSSAENNDSKKSEPKQVRKAEFTKINTKNQQQKISEELDRKAEEQAQIAAKSGVWFEKKAATSQDVKAAADRLTSGGLVKITDKDNADSKKDSIYRRVAKFLVIIGIDEAAKIIPHLTEEQTEKIIPEIATINSVTPEETEEILEEFNALLEKARESGGIDTARSILTKAYGSKKAEDMLEKAVPNGKVKPFEYLEDADPERIKLLIEGESSAVQAVVLSQLQPEKAAGIINSMDNEKKSAVVLRLAKMKTVSPEVIANLDKSLHEKLLTQNTENSRNMDGKSVLAQILKRMSPSSENMILDSLAESDPDLTDDLKKRLFTEEDVLKADNKFIQKMLQDMSNDDVVILIKGKSDAFRNKILSNVSKGRGGEILEDELLKQYVKKSDSEEITSRFYNHLRSAWERGELQIIGRDDDEVYV